MSSAISTAHSDVLIIGGGAAGLMCAIEAGKRGRSVMLLDHSGVAGNKIAVSGGGRCNFTNLHAAPENYISSNPNFCKSALARYTPLDFVGLIEKHRVPYHEKKLGQLFCSESSQRIVGLLLEECRVAHVKFRFNCRIQSVRKTTEFHVETDQGTFSSHALVIATGGLSFPKLGATDFGHRLARQFGLKITQTRPGLVPLKFDTENQNRYQAVSGVSVAAVVHCQGREFRENILLTHRGLSGPAALQASSYWETGKSVQIDLLPGLDAGKWIAGYRARSMELATLLSRHLPRRFVERWCEQHFPSKPMNQFQSRELTEIGRLLNHWTPLITGTEGYAKAEVTVGGVDTRELSSRTMETRNVRGLFFIGEVVDVTGWLGGYNFQWAWASGHAAGASV